MSTTPSPEPAPGNVYARLGEEIYAAAYSTVGVAPDASDVLLDNEDVPAILAALHIASIVMSPTQTDIEAIARATWPNDWETHAAQNAAIGHLRALRTAIAGITAAPSLGCPR